MSSRVSAFLVWNRRLHYYIGLYLLFFCWLFAFTGLLLNHPKWTFADFWPNRSRSTTVRDIRVAANLAPLERAKDVSSQLEVNGEIQLPVRQPRDDQFAFQINRPGHIVEVSVDALTGRATLQRSTLNAWGVMNLLHTFTGVRTSDAINDRDWILTTIWAFAMDAVCIGLLVMVLSSYVMWYRLDGTRLAGFVALALGLTCCAGFVFGIRMFLG
jgi:hypothetical protein